MENMKEMNRRDFLRKAGKAALGAVAVSSLPVLAVAEEKEAPVWPWKYVPLDKDALLELCYKKFYEYGGCGGGCFGGIIDIFSEVTGYPYNQMTPGRTCAPWAARCSSSVWSASLRTRLPSATSCSPGTVSTASRNISRNTSPSPPWPIPSTARIPWAPTWPPPATRWPIPSARPAARP